MKNNRDFLDICYHCQYVHFNIDKILIGCPIDLTPPECHKYDNQELQALYITTLIIEN